MILRVLKYGDPVLRRKGAPVEAITPEIRQFIADMLETMADARGIGLAAQQVGSPLLITTLDIRDVKNRPSYMWINGQDEADPEAFMPMILINPKIRPMGKLEPGPEGCLSFPEIFGDIPRPSEVEVEALDSEGRPIQFRAGGLLARAIQHEVDHLHGILFIDRMDSITRQEVRPDVEELMQRTKASLARASS